MYISIGMMAIGAIWLIWEYIKYTHNLDDKPKVTKPKVTDIPTSAEIERYNSRIDEQMSMYHQKVKQHIIDILDTAYKDYISEQINKGMYISCTFILNVGDYGLTLDEIYAIRGNSFSHGIYAVEYMYESCFHAPWLVVTVNN
jgi:hypothetical protein